MEKMTEESKAQQLELVELRAQLRGLQDVCAPVAIAVIIIFWIGVMAIYVIVINLIL